MATLISIVKRAHKLAGGEMNARRQGGKAVGQIKRGAIDIDREQTGTLNIRHTLRTSNGCLAMATASDCSQEMSDIFYPKKLMLPKT